MCNVAANIGKQMQCAVDIKSLQPWSASVGSIPYMVVAEELLRLATFTTEFDIKAVIADRVAYCFEMVYEHVQKDLRGSSDMINNPGQTFKRCQHTGVGSEIRWPGEASEDGQRW